jgi:hypothetical protein
LPSHYEISRLTILRHKCNWRFTVKKLAEKVICD